MTIEEIRSQLWARVYGDCLDRGILWFEAKEEADRSVFWFDKRVGVNAEVGR